MVRCIDHEIEYESTTSDYALDMDHFHGQPYGSA